MEKKLNIVTMTPLWSMFDIIQHKISQDHYLKEFFYRLDIFTSQLRIIIKYGLTIVFYIFLMHDVRS